MPIPWFSKRRAAGEPAVLIGDPRVEDWETVSTFEQQATAVAWRDHAAARPAQPLGCSSADEAAARATATA